MTSIWSIFIQIGDLFIVSTCSRSRRQIYNVHAISKRSIKYMQCANISTMNDRRSGPVTRITNVPSIFLSEAPGISYVSSQTHLYSIWRVRFSDFFTCILATCLYLKPSCAGLILCLPFLSVYVSPQRVRTNSRRAEQF